MADDKAATDSTPQQNERGFSIQKVYVKDVSLETPNSPQIFTEQAWTPEVNLQLESKANQVTEGMYEVVLTLTVTTKNTDKIAYLIEVQQAGLFALTNFPDTELGPMLGSFCPNILFPFAREEICALASKAGFPQLLLEPINFDSLYAQRVQQAAQQTAQPAGQPTELPTQQEAPQA